MKVLFAGGGTAGHITPSIAIAKKIKEKITDAEIVFVGASGGIEQRLIPKEGYKLYTLNILGLKRSIKPKAVAENFKRAFKMLSALKNATKIINTEKPDIVIGTGGYASFPIVYAASKSNIKIFLHESNAYPGLAVRFLAKYAKNVMLSFEESKKYFKNKENLVVTGNPIREEIIFKNRQEAREELGLKNDDKLLITAFGSLGAKKMNEIMLDFLKEEIKDRAFKHIYATGSFGYKWMPEKIKKEGIELKKYEEISLVEYIYNMPTAMAAADLMLCRAGAMTTAELCVCGTPSIIIPSPNVAENHQEKNARALEKNGAAEVMLESELTGERLYKKALELLNNQTKLKNMRKNAQAMANYDSAEKIYKLLISK